jgi:hypothetical protein
MQSIKVLSGAGNQGYIDILAAGAATLVAGVFIGYRYISTAFGRPIWGNYFRRGDTTQDVEAYIIDDSFCVFAVQTGGTSGAALGTLDGNHSSWSRSATTPRVNDSTSVHCNPTATDFRLCQLSPTR